MSNHMSKALSSLRYSQLDYATPNYCFRSFVKADVYPLLAACQNPHFNRFLLWAPPKDMQEAMIQARKLIREDSLNQSVTFSIVEQTTGRWAGFLRWLPFRDGLTISLWMHPDFWGNGATRELSDGVLQVAFEVTDLDNLYALMQPENRGSIRLAKAQKMVYVDALDLSHDDGQPRTVHVYHVQRKDYMGVTPLSIF